MNTGIIPLQLAIFWCITTLTKLGYCLFLKIGHCCFNYYIGIKVNYIRVRIIPVANWGGGGGKPGRRTRGNKGG